ncbi:MAG: response regulator [Deltaproteobacteria bacterium]|nr:response regulator [Deltaproteobacteria bacterium]
MTAHLVILSGSPDRRPIMVVDDEPIILRSLRRQLNRWGYSVVTAEQGSSALLICRDFKPCLVITDLLMPEMDGYELMRRLREEYGTLTPPLAVLTGDTRRRDLRAQPGVISVLLKPAPLSYLRTLVDSVCSAHRRPPYILPEDSEETPFVA